MKKLLIFLILGIEALALAGCGAAHHLPRPSGIHPITLLQHVSVQAGKHGRVR